MATPAWRSNGRSVWLCPFHEESHPSFCTLPPKSGYKDRFKCWVCGAWGDEHDLLKLFHPREDYGDRLVRLSTLRAEFEAHDSAKPEPSGFSHRGGSRKDDDRNVELAFADLDDVIARPVPDWATGRLAVWRLLAHAADVAWRCNTTLDDLATYCAKAILFYRKGMKEHAATCTDPECLKAAGKVEGTNHDDARTKTGCP